MNIKNPRAYPSGSPLRMGLDVVKGASLQEKHEKFTCLSSGSPLRVGLDVMKGASLQEKHEKFTCLSEWLAPARGVEWDER